VLDSPIKGARFSA